MLSWFENGQFEIHEKTGAPVDQDSPGRMVGFNDELPQMLERAAATADAECGIVDAMRGNRQTENKTATGVRLAQEQAEHQLRAMQAQAQRDIKERWNNELLAKKIEWPAPATDAEVRDHFKQLALGKVSMAEAEAFEPRLMARRRENEAKGR
jgi:hypothetical protein